MNDIDKIDDSFTDFYEDTTPDDEKFTDFVSVIQKLFYSKEMAELEERIVDYIIKRYYIKTIRDDNHEELYIYKGGIYHPNGKTYIKEIVIKVLAERYNRNIVRNVLDKIMAKTYIDPDEFFSQQNNNPYLLPVNNGIFDIANNLLLPYSHNYYFFNKLSIDYKKDSYCPNFIKFLQQITKCKEDRLVIQELFGFALVKDYIYEKAFMFYGHQGRNGKSKLLSILKHFIGSSNCSSISLQDLEDDQFAVSSLRNKFVNIGSDISNQDISYTGVFKRCTGRDPIEANRKNQSRITFVNYAKMIFTANELPRIKTTSDAFWQRWVMIDFPNQFLPKKELDKLEKKEREGVYLQDPNIINSIMTTKEMEGIFIWAIDGIKRLIQNKDFSNKETSLEIKRNWLRNSNSVAAFIMDEIEESYEKCIRKKDFKRNYLAYCRNNKIKPLSDKVIKITIENETGASSDRHLVGNEREYIWDGITFKEGSQYGANEHIEDEEEQKDVKTWY